VLPPELVVPPEPVLPPELFEPPEPVLPPELFEPPEPVLPPELFEPPAPVRMTVPPLPVDPPLPLPPVPPPLTLPAQEAAPTAKIENKIDNMNGENLTRRGRAYIRGISRLEGEVILPGLDLFVQRGARFGARFGACFMDR
jgi:hypothetical protein